MSINKEECERLISVFLENSEIKNKIEDLITRNERRLHIDLDKLRQFSPDLTNELIKHPSKIINFFEDYLNSSIEQHDLNRKVNVRTLNDKGQKYKVTFVGNFGKNMVSPRGLNANLSNQLVCVQGIVTRISIPRHLLVKSYHYCEETKKGLIKEYFDSYSINPKELGNETNAVPNKDKDNNPLTFEYGLSSFKNFQTILIQEPPERTPIGQLPRSIEAILEDDLVDSAKPGDRINLTGMFKCISHGGTMTSGNFRTSIISTSVHSISKDANIPKISGEDIKEIKLLSAKEDIFDLLSESLAPAIYGSERIKKALLLQLLGGVEKNLENGTHLRGDINIMLIGDPSTAKSQFLRHILNLAPNSIATTGRGSTGVGLTAAVVIDKDTGERNLEAGAMVLADRGIVCIDEFDKMNEIDRVAIHEVMEQQTVTIAKAGIHVQLNARCSVLAAANPIYGEYQQDLSASKNIGMPDSLLSRFDLVFIVLDENDLQLDRRIADRVIKNHMMPIEIPDLITAYDERVIEPNIENENENEGVYDKNHFMYKGTKKIHLLKKSFVKKFIFYAKKFSEPQLTTEASEKITEYWSDFRKKYQSKDEKDNLKLPITVRTLETLIRLSSAHAKIRLSKVITEVDVNAGYDLLYFTLLGETDEEKQMRINQVEIENDKLSKENQKQIKKILHEELKSKEKIIEKNELVLDNEELFDYGVKFRYMKDTIDKMQKHNKDLIQITELFKKLKEQDDNMIMSMTELIKILRHHRDKEAGTVIFWSEESGYLTIT